MDTLNKDKVPVPSFVAEALLAVAIFLELYALWRALSLEYDGASEYRKTLRGTLPPSSC